MRTGVRGWRLILGRRRHDCNNQIVAPAELAIAGGQTKDIRSGSIELSSCFRTVRTRKNHCLRPGDYGPGEGEVAGRQAVVRSDTAESYGVGGKRDGLIRSGIGRWG